MGEFNVERTNIDGLKIITPRIFGDNRGYFVETYAKKDFEAIGITCDLIKDNESFSSRGVIRGLHYQKEFSQSKLVRVVRGAVYDVAVDLRPGSPTFGEYHGVVLTEENQKQFFIPKSFAHGFLVLSPTAKFVYKCDDYYHPDDEGGIIWNDPTVNIDWPLDEIGGAENLVFSEKDQKWPTLQEFCKKMNEDGFDIKSK